MIYVVCSDTEFMSQHPDVQSARDEASRLSIATPGTNFWVYAPNIHYFTTAPVPAWNYCTNTGVPV